MTKQRKPGKQRLELISQADASMHPDRAYWILGPRTDPGNPNPGFDSTRFPGGWHEDWRFDVPRDLYAALKKRLRVVLRADSTVKSATMLGVWPPDVDDGILTIVVEPAKSERALAKAWNEAHPSEQVVFLGAGRDAISGFAKLVAVPFYVRNADLPEPLSTPALLKWLASLPDRPRLRDVAKMFARYAPEDEPESYRQYALEETRKHSTHGKAKRLLTRLVAKDGPFALLLRNFTTETFSGTLKDLDLDFQVISYGHPMEKPIAQIAKAMKLPLVGIANPTKSLPSRDVLHLEAGDQWLPAVVSLIARARTIFVICDDPNEGIGKELEAIRQCEREDATLIVMPGDDLAQDYKIMRMDDPRKPTSIEHRDLMRRRMVTFGTTATSAELTKQLKGRLPAEPRPRTKRGGRRSARP